MITDVSDSKSIQESIEKTEKIFNGLHILFNNAGIMHPSDDNAMTTEDKVWDLTFDINVKGFFLYLFVFFFCFFLFFNCDFAKTPEKKK